MESLSKAIQEPFVTDVIVPGISRIRDEMRIAEQEERIAAQAEAKRAAAAQALQQAAAAEQQGLDAEIAAAVSGVNVPRSAGLAPLPVAGPNRVRRGDARQALSELKGFVSEARAAGRDPVQMVTQGGAWPRHMALLREAGLADVAIEVLYGSDKPIGIATEQLQQTQQRRGEQEAAAAATQRFERALAGELPQVAAQEAQAAMPIKGGKPRYPTGAPSDDPRRLARRAYEKHLKANPGDQEGAIAAAQQAFGASAPQPAAQAAQPQAIQQPQLIEQANRLREQAAALEEEAKGIEATPVYRTFGDHAMAFLDALDSGDVATQMALMESVGGSTDYQPFGKGAVGKAIGKDASMRARRDLLDLKKKYLDAKRREDSAMKLVEKKAELRGKKTKTGGRGGGGYGKKNDLLLDALVTLNRGDNLTDKQKSQLRRAGGLSESEVSSLAPDRPAAWRALTRRVRGKRAESEARDIMRGQATPEERERADERREAAEIKRLDAKAKTAATQAERQASANEAKRLRLTRDIRGANGRLDRAQARSRDLARGIANNKAIAARNQEEADAITGTDEKSQAEKKKLKNDAKAASTLAQQGEAEKRFADKTVNRITVEISDYEAQLLQLPAKAD
jgi:hypothetical protein